MSNDVFPPTKYEKLEAKHAALEQAVKDAISEMEGIGSVALAIYILKEKTKL